MLTRPRFLACAGATGAPESLRTNVVPAGVVGGGNTVFTTPDKFVHDGTANEAVYLRGKRVLEGLGNDYVASESGGVGTGYDTVTFAVAPLAFDNILIDYFLTA